MATPAIYVIADRLAPRLRAAFLAAIAEIQSQTELGALTAAIESGDVARILAAVKIAHLPAALAPAVAVVASIVTQAAEHALTEIAVRASFTIVNPAASTAARTQGARLVTVVTNETRTAIRALTASAFPEGIAPRELAKLIKPMIGLNTRQVQAVLNYRTDLLRSELSAAVIEAKGNLYAKKLLQQRALNIARTETIDAATAGQLAAWKDAAAAGLLNTDRTSRVWSAASDARTCERCAFMDEQEVPFDAPFIDDAGSEIWAPTLHPSCRCSVSLVFDRARSAA